jgi:DNA mismatch repair protein MutL
MSLRFESNQPVLEIAVHAEGTLIEVHDLFYNLPVRKKFLKSSSHEWQSIEALVKRFALSAPAVAIKLFHNQRLILDLPSASVLQEHLFRVRKIWGLKFFEHAQYFEIERSGLKIWGWLTCSAEHRSQTDRLWIFLNGRIIQDRLLLQALKHAYMAGLPEGRHPQLLMYFEMPLDLVDVNVHPAKHEVRFEQPRLIFDFIVSSLRPYWQPLSALQPSTGHHQSGLTGIHSGHGFHSHAKTMHICNSDYMLLPYSSQIFYLVDVNQWWQHHFQQQLARRPMPWPSRTLSMPVIKMIPKISLSNHAAIEAKCQLWGMDIQFWGEDRLCIRGIPECFAQIDLQSWLQIFKSNIQADDLNLQQLFAATRLSTYDFDDKRLADLIQDLELGQTNPQELDFAKCLDLQNCRKLFQ